MNFGSRLRRIREDNQLSPLELAEKLGISRTSLFHYEKGEREPIISLLVKIHMLFGTDLHWLITGEYLGEKDDDLKFFTPLARRLLVAVNNHSENSIEKLIEYLESLLKTQTRY